ncbi:protease (pspA) related protein [Thermoplasma acidophilum]|uniref:Protease (PspA) related protein n=1 Tax=Thermoplasma acidophilum (strain ATCC 25905 / DSM 1728 / JCM 9062 / NBRC 15155 / AMRC-C165) TaxID=273075 RepID=Q9HLZ9_THEAC|nr:signal peptide peptidase SppA [Thermoplasma acidophilum]CAC11222.1 protease (pspA) related protein [Thermoplasma acidophilum]
MYILRTRIEGTITQQLYRSYYPIFSFAENKRSVAGLVLVFNSGGGDAVASQLMFEMIRKIRKKKPVYSFIQGICASGAYWISAGSSKIYSLDTSLIGSIGVISMIPYIKPLLDKIGVEMKIYKVGKYKDMLSSYREPSDEENEHYMRVLNDVYRKFRDSVMTERNIPEDKMEDIAQGQIFSPSMAMENRLIDGIGTMDSMMDDMYRQLGRKYKTRDILPRRPWIMRFLGT